MATNMEAPLNIAVDVSECELSHSHGRERAACEGLLRIINTPILQNIVHASLER